MMKEMMTLTLKDNICPTEDNKRFHLKKKHKDIILCWLFLITLIGFTSFLMYIIITRP